jgi:alpha-L-fucosidase
MEGGRRFTSDVKDPAFADFYGPAVQASGALDRSVWHNLDWRPFPDAAFLDDWLARCAELVDKYQPQIFWFDWWIEQLVFQPYIQQFAAYYYNRAAQWNLGPAINYKYQSFPPEAAVFDVERGKLPGINPHFWQTDTSVSYRSWGYIENDEFKPVDGLVHDLVDIVSKNGCLLLNIGPRADGTIPEGAANSLREIGAWLRVNGEAIYGTRPWEVFGEGDTPIPAGFKEKDQAPYTPEDIRYTRKGDTLYAICLGWAQGEWLCKSLGSSSAAGTIRHVELLGSGVPLTWRQDEQGLHVAAPAEPPCRHAYTLKISR